MTTRLYAATAALALALTLGACSDDSTPPRASSTIASTAASTPASGVTVRGGDAALTAAVQKVYAAATAPVDATASLGTWKGERVAVVTAGKDTTLLVGGSAGDPAWRVVGGWWPALGKPQPQLGKGPRFVLALGSDARKGKTLKGTRADTIQIIALDLKGGGGVIGVARDVWAPMPGGRHAKINAAYAIGGGKAQVAAVKAVSGLPIEGYGATGFGGFEAIVDDAGGIPIVVPKTVNATHAKLVIKAGPQVLSGKEALAYARERKSLPDGDFGRSRHQGDLILAAGIRARLAGPAALPKVMTSVSEHTDSDLSAEQVITFAAAFYHLDPKKVKRTVAAGGFGWSNDGQSIVILDDKARKAFRDARDGRL